MPIYNINYIDRFSSHPQSVSTTEPSQMFSLWVAAKPGAPLSLWLDGHRLAAVEEWSPGVWRVS